MNPLSLTLLWCALQTTLLALLTLVLSSRPWRIGGASAPLFGLIGVSIITLLAFLPIPWSWTLGSLDRTSLAIPMDSKAINVETEEQDANALFQEGKRVLTGEGLEARATFLGGFLEGLRNSTESSPPGWSLSPISAIVLGLFGAGLAIGTGCIFRGPASRDESRRRHDRLVGAATGRG